MPHPVTLYYKILFSSNVLGFFKLYYYVNVDIIFNGQKANYKNIFLSTCKDITLVKQQFKHVDIHKTQTIIFREMQLKPV